MKEWLRELYEQDSVDVDQPTLTQLNYRPANSDGSAKRCGNCVFFVTGMNLCLLHPKSHAVNENGLCNWQLHGNPHDDWEPHSGLEPLTPELSGYRDSVGGGEACKNCQYFDAEGRSCNAARNENVAHARVNPLGFCSHHEEAEAEEE